MSIREIRTGTTCAAVLSLEDVEVRRVLGEVEQAAAALRYADERLTLAVSQAVVEAGSTWADVAAMLWGTRERRWVDRVRGHYGQAVEDYRQGVPWVLSEAYSPAVRGLLG